MKISFRWLNRFFSHNRELKLISLALGILSFYAIRAATSDQMAYEIPVEVSVEEEGIAILEQNPYTVTVTFRGSAEDFLRLAQKHIKKGIKAVVRPQTEKPSGSEAILVKPRNIVGAREMRVVNIEPQSISVTFDREVEREFLVAEPQTIGEPLRGKVEITHRPKMVKILGPETRLEAAPDVVATEPIDIEGRLESFTKEVRIISPISWASKIQPETIEAKVNIITESISRKWTNIIVLAMAPQNQGKQFTFDPPVVDVTVHGGKKLVNNISLKDITVFADCTKIDPSTGNMAPVLVHLPHEANLQSSTEPEKVKVSESLLKTAIEEGIALTNAAVEVVGEQ